MRFLQVEVENVRGLRGPLRVSLEPGINVIFGPNEIGKSTIEQAIWAGLSMPSKGVSEAQRLLRPRAGGDPRIRLDFEHRGDRFSLEKEFAGAKGRTSLTLRLAAGGVEQLTGGEAEERVREALGLGEPVRGEIKEQQQGFWPLVRITRDTAITAPGSQLNDSTRASLGERLAAASGEVLAGDLGEDLLKRAEQEYLRYFTAEKGQERRGGPLQKARDEAEKARLELRELQERRGSHERDVDDYSRLEERLRALELEAPRHQQALRAAAERAEKARGLRAEIQLAEAELSRAGADAQQWRERIGFGQRLEEDTRRVLLERGERERALREAERLRGEHKLDERALQRKATAEEQRAAGSERWERRLGAWSEVRRERARWERLRADREAAVGLQESVRSLQVELRGLGVDEAALVALNKLWQQSEQLRMRLEAESTTILIRALGPLRVDDGLGERLLAVGEAWERSFSQAGLIRLGEHAELEVRPGGAALGTIVRDAAGAAESLRAELARLGVRDVEEARGRLERRKMANLELRGAEEQLKRVAPGGLAALEAELLASEQAIARAQERAEPGAAPPLPPEPEVEEQLARAREELTEARQAREAATTALRAHGERDRELQAAVLTADAAFAAAERTLAERQAALEEHRARFPGAGEALAIAVGKREQAESRRKQVELTLGQPELAWADQDLRRAEGAVEQHRRELENARSNLDLVRGRLGAADALNLHERVAAAEAAQEQTAEALSLAEREAEAARLLWETLRECREQARERYLAPLNRQAGELLGVLFPGAKLELKESDYDLARVQRGEDDDTFDQLSSGAKEQLGLVVRLAMAKLLAGEDGLPILLDDALVGTDEHRLARMVRVLHHSAPKLQVLLFTCHWDRLRVAGLTADHLVDLERLRRS